VSVFIVGQGSARPLVTRRHPYRPVAAFDTFLETDPPNGP
jgi:hypothetical protein